MKKTSYIISLLLLTVFAFSQQAFAADDSFTQKDRELLVRLDERLNQIDKRFEQIDKRFEQVDKRFEQVDKRFEQVDKRIQDLRDDMNRRLEDVNKRFDFMSNIMIGIVSAFAAIVAVTIGFAIWDRRTMIRPFEDKVKKIESDIANDHEKLHNLITALKKLAKADSKLAEVLRSFSLL